MMSGSSQDWKLMTMSRYTSRMAKPRPTARPINERRMLSTCPRMTISEPRGSSARYLARHPVDGARRGAQVHSLHPQEHVESGHDVVMRDVGGRIAPAGCRQVGQQLRVLGRRRKRRRHDGRILQRAQRVHAILRRLHEDAVVHAVGGVQPEVRRRLVAGTQRNEQVGRHVLLHDAKLAGQRGPRRCGDPAFWEPAAGAHPPRPAARRRPR